eukprot:g6100.t1
MRKLLEELDGKKHAGDGKEALKKLLLDSSKYIKRDTDEVDQVGYEKGLNAKKQEAKEEAAIMNEVAAEQAAIYAQEEARFREQRQSVVKEEKALDKEVKAAKKALESLQKKHESAKKKAAEMAEMEKVAGVRKREAESFLGKKGGAKKKKAAKGAGGAAASGGGSSGMYSESKSDGYGSGFSMNGDFNLD